MLSIVGMLEGFACPAAGMPGAAGAVRSAAGMPGAAGSVRRLLECRVLLALSDG